MISEAVVLRKIILASGSPRRRELLTDLGIKFEIMVDNSSEVTPKNASPDEVVMTLAKNKLCNVAKNAPNDSLIIAADTVVAYNGRILGKPKDEAQAFEMLSALSGQRHSVYTGIAVGDNKTGKTVCEFEKTDVYFRKLEDDEIKRYISTGEPMDKAGAYGIQNLGALFVEKINGDYFNVVGLPLCRLGKILKDEFELKTV